MSRETYTVVEFYGDRRPIELQGLLDASELEARVQQRDLEAMCRETFLSRWVEDGPTNTLRSAGSVNEAVLPRTPGSSTSQADLLNAMLKTRAGSELVLIDGYLAVLGGQPDIPTYVALLDQILTGILTGLSRLVLVTRPSPVNNAVLAAIAAHATNVAPGLVFEHRTSDRFHDRFWLTGPNSGLVVGCSVNGLGFRYALADYLDPADAAVIWSALAAEGIS